jgi:hypothetical protein
MKFGYIVFAKFLLFSHGGLARGLGGVYRRTGFILMENSNFLNKTAKIGNVHTTFVDV